MFSMKDLIPSDPRLYQVMAPACAFWCQHGFSKARTTEERGAPKFKLTSSRKRRHLSEKVVDLERGLVVVTLFFTTSINGGLGMISISINAQRNLVSKLLHSCSDILVFHLAVKPSGWLHEAALKLRRYDQWDFMKMAHWSSPVVKHKKAFVIKITQLVIWVLSIQPLPFEHYGGIMRSLQTPMLLYLAKTGNVVITWASLSRKD